ncbi:glutamic acid-rich protein-like isoform X1 [Salarias fasciatus]|uniref:glutamic acid-rich protein-like isoform X1 n=1 Tax=Salarias fasciatus TaxID=181472 RepID=UPI0011769E26|nr:glutamic acid-rich protein-like isoform X1 [Salarias fasciatus]
MTAKHRKGKNNHKHEDNFFKNDAPETEVRAGGNNYALLLVLFLMIVIGGATGAWFCFQQHQTLTYLTDNLMGMQMKIVKLQSSHEEMRRSNSKPLSESVETRLNALEESYALAQKQVGMALATAEQLKTSDLPAQVLSLHTEMKARMAEMQQASVSPEQLDQLQAALKGKSEEFEGVRIQVEGVASLTGELSKKVDVLTGSLGEAESKLEERAEQVTTLGKSLIGQASEVVRLKSELAAYQAQLEASVLEMAAVRELLEKEDSQRLQQASVEQQLNTVRQSLLDQNSAAVNLHSELSAQLENIQQQVTQPEGGSLPPAESLEQTEEEEEAPPAAEEEPAAAEGGLPAAEQAEEQPEAGSEAAAPVEQDSVTGEAAPAEEVEEEGVENTEKEEEEKSVEGETPEENEAEGEEVQEEAAAQDENSEAGDEEEEQPDVEEEQQDAAEDEPEEESLEEDASVAAE